MVAALAGTGVEIDGTRAVPPKLSRAAKFAFAVASAASRSAGGVKVPRGYRYLNPRARMLKVAARAANFPPMASIHARMGPRVLLVSAGYR